MYKKHFVLICKFRYLCHTLVGQIFLHNVYIGCRYLHSFDIFIKVTWGWGASSHPPISISISINLWGKCGNRDGPLSPFQFGDENHPHPSPFLQFSSKISSQMEMVKWEFKYPRIIAYPYGYIILPSLTSHYVILMGWTYKLGALKNLYQIYLFKNKKSIHHPNFQFSKEKKFLQLDLKNIK